MRMPQVSSRGWNRRVCPLRLQIGATPFCAAWGANPSAIAPAMQQSWVSTGFKGGQSRGGPQQTQAADEHLTSQLSTKAGGGHRSMSGGLAFGPSAEMTESRPPTAGTSEYRSLPGGSTEPSAMPTTIYQLSPEVETATEAAANTAAATASHPLNPPPWTPPPHRRRRHHAQVPAGAKSVRIPRSGPARFHDGASGGLYRFMRSSEVDLNFDWRSWASNNDVFRHLRNMTPIALLRSCDIRRIFFPDAMITGIIASSVVYYNSLVADEVMKVLDTDGDGDVSMEELRVGVENGIVEARHVMGTDFFVTGDMLQLQDLTPFTLTALCLGLVLTFRMQNCNGRYTEARALWGGIINEGRAVSSRILALSRAHVVDGEPAHASAKHAVKWVQTFPHTVKYHLTVDGFCLDLKIHPDMSDAEVNEIKGAAMRQELGSVWNYNVPEEKELVDRLLVQGAANRPLHVLHEISDITAQVLAKPRAEGGVGLSDVHVNEIYRSITRFHDILGACERIYRTPIYTGYSRFTSRALQVWTNLLPLALYPTLGPACTVPTSMTVALFLYGLEDVGTRIEQPFECLPLWQYCGVVDASCAQLLAQHETLELLRNADAAQERTSL